MTLKAPLCIMVTNQTQKGNEMPRKKIPKECGCGCGQMTAGGDFKQGHDSKTLSAIIKQVGGVLELKELIEKIYHKPIAVEHD